MQLITNHLLDSYRKQTFSLLPELMLKSIDEAVAFVNDRGFTFFWPIQGIQMPSLWMAVSGGRELASDHADPAHITWEWKDSLLGSRRWYYAKVLRKKSTMISFELVPCFYSLSDNFGAYDEDYLSLYEQGRLSLEEKWIYESILKNGLLDTVQLRRMTHLSSSSSESRFIRAITNLQANFMILPVGVTNSGAWRYAFAYDIVARHYPEIPSEAQNISEQTAIQKLILAYTRMLGAVDLKAIQQLFGWSASRIQKAVEKLILDKRLLRIPKSSTENDTWLVFPDLLVINR